MAYKVDICIVTRRREDHLKRLLEEIKNLKFKDVEPPEIKIIIVENDKKPRAFHLIDDMRKKLPYPVEYILEEKIGISFARNKALAYIREDCDFVAFIDDDEIPHSLWLNNLIKTYLDYKSPVVVGRVEHDFEIQPPEWLIKSRINHIPVYKTGTKIDHGYTGNTLIKREVIKKFKDEFGQVFDINLSQTGGEDDLFFKTSNKLGFHVIFCNEAITYEFLPKNKMSLTYNLLRVLKISQTKAYIENKLNPGLKTRIIILLNGISRIIWAYTFFTPFLVISLFKGIQYSITPIKRLSSGLGLLLGNFNLIYKLYKFN